MRDKVLGVIGGMGPLASDVFYQTIIENTKAEKDQDHIDMVLLSHASMPDRTECILDGKLDVLFSELEHDFKVLELAGANLAVITCNTCHVVLNQIRGITDIPILNMIEVTAKEALARYGKGAKVGIMATDGTMSHGQYHTALAAHGMEIIEPSQESQKKVMHIIYDCVKCGIEPEDEVIKSVTDELFEKGASCIILGCTELSAIRKEKFSDERFIDPMVVAARISIKAAGGELR